MKKVVAARRTYASLRVGESASVERTITTKDMQAFADLSGDYNPLHMDAAYAKKTPLGSRTVHGMMLGALVSQLVGMKLPGKYALLVKESLEFAKPLLVGETVKVTATICHKSDVMRVIELTIEVTRKGDRIASGSAYARVLK